MPVLEVAHDDRATRDRSRRRGAGPAAPGRHCWSPEEVARGEEIHTAHAEGERALKGAVKYFVRCGNLLLKAKAEIGHGQFNYFLRHQAKLHPRIAQRYLLLARSLPQLPAAKATRLSQLSLRDAMGELSRLSSRAAKLPTRRWTMRSPMPGASRSRPP